MEIVEIRITAWQVSTARYGVLTNGDVLRTDAAFARLLVEVCAAAEYTGTQTTAPAPAAVAKRPRKAKQSPE